MTDQTSNALDRSTRPIGPEQDPAAKSLADALRVSFRLLTAIMVIVVVAFLLSGFKSIEPQQVGIKKVFGRVVGTAEQGLAYTWPYPVGQIDAVTTSQRKVVVEEFWLHETAKDRTKKLIDRRAPSQGLRPGWEGALLTGDRNLLHVKLECLYAIEGSDGALACARNIGEENLDRVVTAVVCRAAIDAAGRRTADGIQRTEKSEFARDVRIGAQRSLNELTKVDGKAFQAVRINVVNVGRNCTWPLRALPAYNQAQNAVQKWEELRNAAIADARNILNAAAGASYEVLVGPPEAFIDRKAARPDDDRPHDLIGQYVAAESGSPETQRLLDQIEDVLVSNATGGQASRIIADAKAYKTQLIQTSEGRAKRFTELLAEYKKTPQFMLERHWADTRDAILDSPTVEKIYLTVGGQKIVYRLSQPQGVAKGIRRERLRADKADQAGKVPIGQRPPSLPTKKMAP